MNLPLGFQFSGLASGIKPSGAPDLAVITTSTPAVAAGVYTQNVVRAASIDWNREITPTDSFRGLVINSGNANACTGEQGIADNQAMAQQLSQLIDANPSQVAVLSTGVIGQVLPMEKIHQSMPSLVNQLGDDQASFDLAAQAILTTDKGTKTVQQTIQLGGTDVNLACIAKGAGMIGPNMATMLAIVMTDAALSPDLAQRLLKTAADKSFNCISVEGHTSTNDALMLICSGQSKATISDDQEVETFSSVLAQSCVELAKQIPADGEGASHLISIIVSGAQSTEDADRVARTIASSALVKTAITGADPNWGRIVSAAGYCGVPMEVASTDLQINGHTVFESGQPTQFDAATVSRSMADQFETQIELKIGSGQHRAQHWTSDLTVDYVRFNSEYTT